MNQKCITPGLTHFGEGHQNENPHYNLWQLSFLLEQSFETLCDSEREIEPLYLPFKKSVCGGIDST